MRELHTQTPGVRDKRASKDGPKDPQNRAPTVLDKEPDHTHTETTRHPRNRPPFLQVLGDGFLPKSRERHHRHEQGEGQRLGDPGRPATSGAPPRSERDSVPTIQQAGNDKRRAQQPTTHL